MIQLFSSNTLAVFTLTGGPVATNTFLFENVTTREAVVVDAPFDTANAILGFCTQRGLTLSSVYLTHTHWDHTADCAPLIRSTGATLYVHPLDAHRLTDPMKYTVWPLPFSIEPCTSYQTFEHGHTVEFGAWQWEVLHTPGHTEGGVCFVDHTNKIVVAGDTLFNGSIGRTDLPGGHYDTLIESIVSRLLPLPDDYRVFCGHGPETSIGAERFANPFLRGAALR